VSELRRVTLSDDAEGDYVVLAERAGGVLRIAPVHPDGAPKVVALKKTCTACPAQWEGRLEDGRTLYARYRWGHLSVGIGDDIDEAIDNGLSEDALYADHVGDGLDGFLGFEDLRAHLYGLAEFPEGLVVEGEDEPLFDPEALRSISFAGPGASSGPGGDDGEGRGAPERPGTGLAEADIDAWVCFSCGRPLTQAHEGDYFHTAEDHGCTGAVPVPRSLVEDARRAPREGPPTAN
jgi:hypothetical protein